MRPQARGRLGGPQAGRLGRCDRAEGEGVKAEGGDGDAVHTAAQAALTPQLVEWFNAQSKCLRDERRRLVEAVSEARLWEEEAISKCVGR